MLLGFKASPILESNGWHLDNLVTAPIQMNKNFTYDVADLILIWCTGFCYILSTDGNTHSFITCCR